METIGHVSLCFWCIVYGLVYCGWFWCIVCGSVIVRCGGGDVRGRGVLGVETIEFLAEFERLSIFFSCSFRSFRFSNHSLGFQSSCITSTSSPALQPFFQIFVAVNTLTYIQNCYGEIHI
uniref:Uncharacterized protein n=1 Tax=Ixodes ricinus TaxID=34613 RepID=A0A6B0UMZ4_IXORI